MGPDGSDAVVGRADVVAHQPEEHGEQIRRVAVVIGNQDSQPADGLLVAARRRHECGCRFRHHRKMDDELAALADPLASGLDPAAMLFDEPPDQRESDPEAALGPFERAVRLIEHLEKARQCVWRDADTCILHAHDDGIFLALGGQ